jgi:hypothetical protein
MTKMSRWAVSAVGLVSAMLLLSGCGPGAARSPTPTGTVPPLIEQPVPITTAVEQPITVIPLVGPAGSPEAEISGMAWYGNYLVLLPQYPDRVATQGEGAVYALRKEDIIAFLDEGGGYAFQPLEITFSAPGLAQQVAGFEGYEAIAFTEGQVFLTIEAGQAGGMQGYLVSGSVAPDLSELRIDPETLTEVPAQTQVSNMSAEALLVAGDLLVVIHEANGAALNPQPMAHLFDRELAFLGTLSFPNIEYRIADVTLPDSSGRFWGINTFFPGDTHLRPVSDPLAEQFREGATHARFDTVERLVEFRAVPSGISLAGSPPIQLVLVDDDHARNWEGVVRLDGRGFLLVTDEHPETILAFVPLP